MSTNTSTPTTADSNSGTPSTRAGYPETVNRADHPVRPFKRVVSPGVTEYGRLYVTIDWDGRCLSLTGVDGPRANGDCRGSCGQTGVPPLATINSAWTEEQVVRLRSTWDRWHLNDMRAACKHQRDHAEAHPGGGWDPSREVEVVTYKLTMDAHRMRDAAIKKAAQAAHAGEVAELTATERALIDPAFKWYSPGNAPPDADSPLSGCLEVDKREKKRTGWVTYTEHPAGILGKPCELCGYEYGSAWLHEPVPVDVLTFLLSLPTDGAGNLPAAWS